MVDILAVDILVLGTLAVDILVWVILAWGTPVLVILAWAIPASGIPLLFILAITPTITPLWCIRSIATHIPLS